MSDVRTTIECTYNIFRCRKAPDFCCAVPVVRPVPGFLNGRWAYAGTVHGNAEHPPVSTRLLPNWVSA
jgi:hypothetical protein